MRVARVELASALAVAAIVTVVAALAVVRTRHAALGATQHQGPAYTHLHAARHLAAAASPGSQAFLFVGGLQRSGTTWLEALVSSSETSALSFENMDLGEYVRLQPWRLGVLEPRNQAGWEEFRYCRIGWLASLAKSGGIGTVV